MSTPPLPKHLKKPTGGKRPGAGRPKGAKSKRTVYKETIAKLTGAEAAYKKQIHHYDDNGRPRDKYGELLGPYYGETPLEFMIAVMRDPKAPTSFRFAAAKDSAPYVHPKLATIEVKSKNLNVNAETAEKGGPLTAEEAAKIYKDLLNG